MRFASAGRTLARVLAAPPPPASRHAALRPPPLRAASLQRRVAHASAAGMDAMEQYMFDLNGYIVVPQARPLGVGTPAQTQKCRAPHARAHRTAALTRRSRCARVSWSATGVQ
jgi:hypothetical protein